MAFPCVVSADGSEKEGGKHAVTHKWLNVRLRTRSTHRQGQHRASATAVCSYNRQGKARKGEGERKGKTPRLEESQLLLYCFVDLKRNT